MNVIFSGKKKLRVRKFTTHSAGKEKEKQIRENAKVLLTCAENCRCKSLTVDHNMMRHTEIYLRVFTKYLVPEVWLLLVS